MFRGDQHLTIDAKGRMAIPTKYRETLLERYDGKLVVTADPESCLLLFTLQDWEEFERNLLKAQQENTLRNVADYSMPNVSDKVLRIILSYTDYVNRVVWSK